MAKMRASIKEPEFKRIIEMARLGLRNSQIAQLTGWSAGAVTLWRKYPTWDAYSEFKKTIPGGRGKSKVVVASTGGPAVTIESKTLVSVLSELVNEVHLLRLAWEKNPREEIQPESNSKKKWFPQFGKAS